MAFDTMRKLGKIMIKLAIIAAALAGTAAQAVTLEPDSGWQLFVFGGVGSPITEQNSGDAFYDFTLTSAAELRVTDAFVIGDQWEFFLNGSSIGTSSGFDLGGTESFSPDEAYAGTTYSTFTFALTPGTYQLTGITTSSPAGAGGAFLQLASTAAVPEPASWTMLITGFGLVGAAARRRRTALTA